MDENSCPCECSPDWLWGCGVEGCPADKDADDEPIDLNDTNDFEVP